MIIIIIILHTAGNGIAEVDTRVNIEAMAPHRVELQKMEKKPLVNSCIRQWLRVCNKNPQ